MNLPRRNIYVPGMCGRRHTVAGRFCTGARSGSTQNKSELSEAVKRVFGESVRVLKPHRPLEIAIKMAGRCCIRD